MDLMGLIEKSVLTAEFVELNNFCAKRRIRTWSTDEERSLLFGAAAFFDDIDNIVEVGTYCGGSCAFLAGGLRHRGAGKIFCVDTFLGGPPWLGVPGISWTLDEFTDNIQALGLASFVEPRVGASTAVAGVWPGIPIDLLFIDGDHSFHGAVADIESWVPKLRKGGHFLIDDIDDIPELEPMTRILREMRSLAFSGRVGGIDVYRVVSPGWELLGELTRLLGREGVARPWDYGPLHATRADEAAGDLPDSRIPVGEDSNYREVFSLASQVVAGNGDYAYTAAAHRSVRDIAYYVSLMRDDGKLFKIDVECPFRTRFRVIACSEDEVQWAAPMLVAGGLLIARSGEPRTLEELEAVDKAFRAAGLIGTTFYRNAPHFYCGVSDPYSLSMEAILSRRLAGCRKYNQRI